MLLLHVGVQGSSSSDCFYLLVHDYILLTRKSFERCNVQKGLVNLKKKNTSNSSRCDVLQITDKRVHNTVVMGLK